MTAADKRDRELLSLFLSQQNLSEYEEAKKRKERERTGFASYMFPVSMLGLAGAGLGARSFADWAVPEESREALSRIKEFRTYTDQEREKPKPAWEDTIDYYTRYMDAGGRATRAKFFGGALEASDVPLFLRKHVLPWVGSKYAIKTPDEYARAHEHYKSFAGGPLQSFLHLVEKEDRPKVLPVLAASVARDNGLEKNRAARDIGAFGSYLQPEIYPWGRQLDQVRGYLQNNPEMRKKLFDDWKTWIPGASSGYGGFDSWGTVLHDIPKRVGTGLLGLGAAGLGGWGLYKLYDMWTKRRREKQLDNEIVAERRRAVSEWIKGRAKARKELAL